LIESGIHEREHALSTDLIDMQLPKDHRTQGLANQELQHQAASHVTSIVQRKQIPFAMCHINHKSMKIAIASRNDKDNNEL
jgi:hypothetical protein